MSTPLASSNLLHRQEVDITLLWSLTGLPPRSAWAGLGFTSEALGYLEQMHDTLEVVSRVWREAPMGDYALYINEQPANTTEEWIQDPSGKFVLRLRFEVSCRDFGPTSKSLQAPVEAWCKETSNRLRARNAESFLWSNANLESAPLPAGERVSHLSLVSIVSRLFQAIPSPQTRAQIEAGSQLFELDDTLPAPVGSSLRVRL